jgi:hypothetical protein
VIGRNEPRCGGWISVTVAVALSACGYRLANEVVDPLGPFCLASGTVRVPFGGAVAAAEDGARAELARAGQLGGCGDHAASQVAVEVVRVDEDSEGVSLSPRPGTSEVPLARALRVRVTARAEVRVGTQRRRATPDFSASEIIATPIGEDPVLAEIAKRDASRRAARRLGARLVRSLLGWPEPGED